MIYSANFKMNHTRASTADYVLELDTLLNRDEVKDRVIVFPPSIALLPSTNNITIGAQNGYSAEKGAFTGEIGLSQLEEFGIKTILIGHSERREIFNETQEFIVKKFDFFRKYNFEIVYCIGEPFDIREKGEKSIFNYLWNQFKGIDTSYEKLIVAYEPIWAIGTGKSATLEDIDKVHKELKREIKSPILYGGSVNLSNINSIASLDSVDGVLVGSGFRLMQKTFLN